MKFIEELFSLKGKVALVTGGSSGIGRAIAQAYAAAGASVIIVARGEAGLEAAVRQIRAEGGTAAWLACDLARAEALPGMAEAAGALFGPPDILVNSAAINTRKPMLELTPEDWRVSMQVNLDAPFLLSQRLAPAMIARGRGRLIHIASQQAFRAFGDSGAYGVSKAGIVQLARAQAEAWSRQGVTANAIVPGFVRTPLSERAFGIPGRPEAMAARTLAGRNGEPADYRGVALFLASPASDYVTGQAIFVDGGFSAS